MAKDPYKYFRVEARELLDGLTRPLLEMEKGTASGTVLVSRLLRLAHTLKGAAHVVKQTAIANSAHGIEDILLPYRDSAQAVPSPVSGEALRLLGEIGAQLSALAPPPDVRPPGAISSPHSGESLETVRVELEDLEALLASLQEACVQVTCVRNEFASLRQAAELAAALVRQVLPKEGKNSGAKISMLAAQLLKTLTRAERGLATSIERTEREVLESQDRGNRLRLLPLERIVPALARGCREAATSLGKRVEVKVRGGEIRIDAEVLALLQDALQQLVRNTVAHGIEDEATRRACGKPAAGRLEIEAERKGSRIRVVCRDDGGGIDATAIRKVAIKKGVISAQAAEALGLREAIDFILRGGVSTTETVTETSGRGIGLDIVRSAVERMRGEISIQTTPGQGTAVEICVPASLTSLEALMLESAGIKACIPLSSVSQALRLSEREIAPAGSGESIAYQSAAIPFLPLSRLIGNNHGHTNGTERKNVVVVRSAEKMVALGVEKLSGSRSILVRALPPLCAEEAFMAGASFDGEGNPVLVLDPAGLARQGDGRSIPSLPRKPKLPLLVVDDSLTTRMVEQNILESVGYQVQAATSAEEALRMAHTCRYGLFLVDIEMPGMDGFQFVTRTREDAALRDIPAILVSSRDSEEDRRRGEEAGARAYFSKGEFDQVGLLATVARLLE
jgi:two-component system chemotaxis sensor kinase CheA